ncbi:MAG: hypothetical protein ACI35T_07530 [Alistipes sp.]
MKKFWKYIHSTPLNPILLILFFTIIGGMLLVLLDGNKKSMEYFLTCVGLGISAAVVQCTLIQNRIQKDNIKIQLFEKRYGVFKSVLDTITIIKRDNWDRYILFNENDINKQMILIEENLYQSVQLSVCLFDANLHPKLVEVNNAFCKITKAYKNMLTANLENLANQGNAQECLSVLTTHILSSSGLGSEKYENDLKEKFPNVYINLMEFSKECEAYITFVEECGILKDLGRYVVVDKLDK